MENTNQILEPVNYAATAAPGATPATPIAATAAQAETRDEGIVDKVGLRYAIGLAIMLGSQFLVSMLVKWLAPNLQEKLGANFSVVMILICNGLIALTAMFLLNRNLPVHKVPKQKLGEGRYIKAIFICYGVMIIGSLIGVAVTFLITGKMNNVIDQAFGGSSSLLMIFVVGICGPIYEELIFRKILIDRMSRYGEKFAIIASGVMFGLFHGNFQQVFYAMFLGFVFAYVYVKSRNILYSISMHMIINLYTSAILMPLMQKAGTDIMSQMYLGLAIIVEFGAAFAGVIILLVSLKKIRVNETLANPGKAGKLFTSWGMWLFYAVIIGLFLLMYLYKGV